MFPGADEMSTQPDRPPAPESTTLHPRFAAPRRWRVAPVFRRDRAFCARALSRLGAAKPDDSFGATRRSRRSARGARSDSPKSDHPRNLTPLVPAAVVSELELSGDIIRRVYEARQAGRRAQLEREPQSHPRPAGAGRTASCSTSRSPRICPGLGLAFPRRRLSLPFRARFGSQGSARGRVDALMAIVPADAIPRRGIAAQHFLNDTGARSAAR